MIITLSESIRRIQGDPFYGTQGPRNAEIMFVGEAWGFEEERLGVPFIGTSGQEFDRILSEVKIDRRKCFMTNVVPARPASGNLGDFFSEGNLKWGLKCAPIVEASLAALKVQIQTVKPKVIVALGNYAFWALSKEATLKKLSKKEGGYYVPAGITDWRSSMLWLRDDYGQPTPLLVTLHPAWVSRQWSQRVYLVHDLSARIPMALEGNWNGPRVERNYKPSHSEVITFLEGILKDAAQSPVPIDLVCDIETKGRNITCVGFATSQVWSICIPFVRLTAQRTLDSYWTVDEELPIYRLLRRVLTHRNICLIGQNFLYDMQYLSVWLMLGTRIKCGFDTMYAHHTLFPGTEKGLDVLSSLYCNHHVFWKHETQEWAETGTLEQLLDYNCTDVLRTFEIAIVVRGLITALKYEAQWEYMITTVATVFKMMMKGVRRDQVARDKLRVEAYSATEVRTRWIEKFIPQSWIVKKSKARWHASSSQQQTIFYDLLGLPAVRHRKTKELTFNDEALNTLNKKVPWMGAIFKCLADLRSLRVFSSLFLDAMLDPDGRFRTSFNPAGTETFRFSSSKNAFHRGGNLQNISSGDE